jgi:tight adherence protein B
VSVVAERQSGPGRRRLASAAALALVLALPAGAAAGSGGRAGGAPASAVVTSTTPTASRSAATRTTNTNSATTTPKPVATKPKPLALKPKALASKLASLVAKAKKAKKQKKAKPLPLLSGWRGAARAPIQTLILSVPKHVRLTPSQIHLTENGSPIGNFSLTPLAQAGSGDFGFVVAADQSISLKSAELNQEMLAVRQLTGRLGGKQQFGLITFGASPAMTLPLTSDRSQITSAVDALPPILPGANVPATEAFGLQQLLATHDAAGAVVVISDGQGTNAGGHAAQAAFATAAAEHIPVITVGLKDSSATAASLRALQRGAPGPYVEATTRQLTGQLARIFSSATSGYVVRYRSGLRPGQSGHVSATADRTRGAVNASYLIPRPPVHHHVARPPHKSAGPSFGGSSVLSGSPSFASSPAGAPTTNSFWTKPQSVAVIALLAALLMATAIMLLLRRPARRAVRTRVGSFTAVEPAIEETEAQQAPSALLRLVARGGWWPKFVQDVDISQSERSAEDLLKRALIAGGAVAAVALLILQNALIALVALFGAPFILKMLIARKARKQRARFQDLLPAHLQDLSGAMRAGRSVIGALSSVAESADEPIKRELERALRDEQLGLPLEETLETIARRMEATDMDQVALVAALNRRSGSNVAEALDRVAEGSRERADLRREVKALTGQAKMSSWILTGLPPLLAIGTSVIAPQYAHPLLHTTMGIVLLVVAACMVMGGWKVMQKIINVKV